MYDDDSDDDTTDFIGKTESKEIKSEDKHFVYVSQLQQDTLEKVMKMCDDGMSFVDVWFEMQEDGYDLKCYSRNHKKGRDMPTRGMLYKNNEFSFVTIINGKDGKCSWKTEGPVYYDENKKVNFFIKIIHNKIFFNFALFFFSNSFIVMREDDRDLHFSKDSVLLKEGII